MELSEINLQGKIFNRWKIISFHHKQGYAKYFTCECLDCNEEKIVYIQNIISGKSKSCGCKSQKENAYNINKKYNEYYIEDNIVNIILGGDKGFSGQETICNLEDWENSELNLKSYYWRINKHGYVQAVKNHKIILLHRLIMGVQNQDREIQVDHIDGNTLNNCKKNLRLCTNQQNSFNKWENKNNTSGYKGVHWDSDRQKWRASIQFNGKTYSSPRRYDDPAEAYEWYKAQTEVLQKEFSVFNSRESD